MRLRLIQLGLGGWGRNWAEEITRSTPGIETVAWVDIDATTLAREGARLGLPQKQLFASLEAALDAVVADAALVVVPLAAHAAVTRQCLDAGLHVLVEKPFTDDLGAARDLVERARQRRRILMVNQNYRWFPAPRRARALLREHAIGLPMACYLDFHFLFGRAYRYFYLDEPLLSDMAIHHFDTLRFVLDDEPVEVSCQSWSEPETPFKGRPAAIAMIRFARGTLVSYRGSWISRGPATPYGGHWRLDGTRGTIEFTFRGELDEREKQDRLILHLPDRPAAPARLPDMPGKDRMGALLDFASWVRDGVPPEGASTGEDNLRSLELMFGAIRSAAMDGQRIRLGETSGGRHE